MADHLIASPLGPLGLQMAAGCLVAIDLAPTAALVALATPAPAWVQAQLDRYFGEPAARFDLPLALRGTPFQRRLWAVLTQIPAGSTRTYGELARLLDSAPRAVGQACRANPWPILVPCHRVVGARGLGGFAGDTSGRLLAVKRWLLHHEGVRLP